MLHLLITLTGFQVQQSKFIWSSSICHLNAVLWKIQMFLVGVKRRAWLVGLTIDDLWFSLQCIFFLTRATVMQLVNNLLCSSSSQLCAFIYIGLLKKKTMPKASKNILLSMCLLIVGCYMKMQWLFNCFSLNYL